MLSLFFGVGIFRLSYQAGRPIPRKWMRSGPRFGLGRHDTHRQIDRRGIAAPATYGELVREEPLLPTLQRIRHFQTPQHRHRNAAAHIRHFTIQLFPPLSGRSRSRSGRSGPPVGCQYFVTLLSNFPICRSLGFSVGTVYFCPCIFQLKKIVL